MYRVMSQLGTLSYMRVESGSTEFYCACSQVLIMLNSRLICCDVTGRNNLLHVGIGYAEICFDLI
jgi:hypothetical protein